MQHPYNLIVFFYYEHRAKRTLPGASISRKFYLAISLDFDKGKNAYVAILTRDARQLATHLGDSCHP